MKGLKKKVGVMSGLAALALVGSAFAVWSKPEEVEIKTISPTVVGSGWTF